MQGNHQGPNQYAYVVERTASGFSAYVPDLPGIAAAARTREGLHRRVREALCLHILGLREDGDEVPAPTPAAELDEVELDLSEGDELAFAEPDEPDSISRSLETLLEEAGVRPSEVARRMDVPRSAVSRLTSPVYHGHSMDSLRRVAESLGYEVEVKFKKAG